MAGLRRLSIVVEYALPLLLILAFSAAVGIQQGLPRSNPGTTAQQAGEAAARDHAAYMQQQRLTEATFGLECWEPAEGRLGSQIAVQWSGTDLIEVIPFTDETYAQGSAGAFWTLRVCA